MQAIKDFSFFSADDSVLFHRADAESAVWSVHEMILKAVFPFVTDRAIQRGMRIGFRDFDGVFQAFEIRTVRTLEPDHCQEITAEHICISELTDRHLFLYQPGTEVTASTALGAVMSGHGWTLGTVSSAIATAEPDIQMTSVWSAICTLRDLYGMRVEPVITVNDTGITGRRLDFKSPDGTWRGVRLSLNKNATQIGVTYDDTNLITAIYGYGQSTAQADQAPAYLTFSDVVWSQTASHPAKPAGQAYLVDPEATALYGRNGAPRFGFYNNAQVSDANDLLELCWEVLKNSNHPTVTIDLKLIDLQRMGYGGQDIRLGDKVLIDVEPTGELLQDVVNTLEVDLLNPLETRPGVGAFIPDIVYIDKSTNDGTDAVIGGGGGGGGGRKAKQNADVWTTFEKTDEYIRMTANRVTTVNNVVTTQGTAIDLNSERILLTASATEWDTLKQSGTRLYSEIQQNAQQITLKVSKGDVSTQLAVECGNVTISGGNLVVDGYVTANELEILEDAWADSFTSKSLSSDTATLGVVDVDEINGITGPQGINISVDGVLKATVLGSGNDVNFDRAAAKREGAAAVVVTLDTGSWTAVDSSTGNYQRTVTAKKDGVSAATDTISAQQIWNLGWNACRAWVLDNGHTVLSGYSSWNSGNATALYVAPTGGAQMATGQTQRWRYGGSVTTYYSAPPSK